MIETGKEANRWPKNTGPFFDESQAVRNVDLAHSQPQQRPPTLPEMGHVGLNRPQTSADIFQQPDLDDLIPHDGDGVPQYVRQQLPVKLENPRTVSVESVERDVQVLMMFLMVQLAKLLSKIPAKEWAIESGKLAGKAGLQVLLLLEQLLTSYIDFSDQPDPDKEARRREVWLGLERVLGVDEGTNPFSEEWLPMPIEFDVTYPHGQASKHILIQNLGQELVLYIDEERVHFHHIDVLRAAIGEHGQIKFYENNPAYMIRNRELAIMALLNQRLHTPYDTTGKPKLFPIDHLKLRDEGALLHLEREIHSRDEIWTDETDGKLCAGLSEEYVVYFRTEQNDQTQELEVKMYVSKSRRRYLVLEDTTDTSEYVYQPGLSGAVSANAAELATILTPGTHWAMGDVYNTYNHGLPLRLPEIPVVYY